MLTAKYTAAVEGDYDRWLDFTSAETGAAFFAPSINFFASRLNCQKLKTKRHYSVPLFFVSELKTLRTFALLARFAQ